MKGKSKFFNKRVTWPGVVATRKINLTAVVLMNQTENDWDVGEHCPTSNLTRT